MRRRSYRKFLIGMVAAIMVSSMAAYMLRFVGARPAEGAIFAQVSAEGMATEDERKLKYEGEYFDLYYPAAYVALDPKYASLPVLETLRLRSDENSQLSITITRGHFEADPGVLLRRRNQTYQESRTNIPAGEMVVFTTKDSYWNQTAYIQGDGFFAVLSLTEPNTYNQPTELDELLERFSLKL